MMRKSKKCPSCGKQMKRDAKSNMFWVFWTCDCDVFKDSQGISEWKENPVKG